MDLSKYKGKVVLVVNLASACGFTPQYAELQALYDKYSSKGLVILGFPVSCTKSNPSTHTFKHHWEDGVFVSTPCV